MVEWNIIVYVHIRKKVKIGRSVFLLLLFSLLMLLLAAGDFDQVIKRKSTERIAHRLLSLMLSVFS